MFKESSQKKGTTLAKFMTLRHVNHLPHRKAGKQPEEGDNFVVYDFRHTNHLSHRNNIH
jgi:hypothetical protein